MYYEIYVDSLLLLHFFMNLYMLALVNHMLYNTASGKRMVLGATYGAFCSIIPLLIPVNLSIRFGCGFLISIFVMSGYTFRICHRKQFFRVLEKMLLATLLLGGMLLFLLKILPQNKNTYSGVIGVLALGALCYLLVNRMITRKTTDERECKVIYEKEKGCVEVKALMDTGNTLIEPVSGKPVAVVGEETLLGLFHGKLPETYRIIPFQSVGTKHGLLKGYLLKTMIVEVQGIHKECKNIYVAMSGEILSEGNGYQVILSPQMLEK